MPMINVRVWCVYRVNCNTLIKIGDVLLLIFIVVIELSFLSLKLQGRNVVVAVVTFI